MNKLRSLLAVVGMMSIGGVLYLLTQVKPGVTRADLLDAGIAQECDPVQVSCQVRQTCFPNQARYGTVQKLAFQCDRDGGVPVLIALWPKGDSGADCFEPVGPPDTACVVQGASFDDGGDLTRTTADQDRCACRPTDGGVCRFQSPDGSTPLMHFRETYRAPFAGAGCVRKSCEEFAGELGQSMPPECL